ncbi:hypothetical protein TRFO_35214 [Tritrichomonas foetus]|uniref:CYTH domain-containing protein n=1 Tax=Tritrichomonas foetus TaxID=1144522 RepID=A0A1J4JJ88_9EUKA|nr:hypothetical protein TRFO_35214 [Tritrichomonas foetus]|eukprot:OHS98399.1 hypothetical protein TRFO_35214 [Tritrichomonas foetus]
MSNPNLIFKLSPQIIQNELQEVSSSKFEIIGDFRTIRRVISFAGMKIEADESFLPDNSVFFELEIECENPQQAKKEIEAELNKIGVSFVDSTKGKMARLMSLPPEKRISRKSCVID